MIMVKAGRHGIRTVAERFIFWSFGRKRKGGRERGGV